MAGAETPLDDPGAVTSSPGAPPPGQPVQGRPGGGSRRASARYEDQADFLRSRVWSVANSSTPAVVRRACRKPEATSTNIRPARTNEAMLAIWAICPNSEKP